jgi:uncharacterized protein (DUF1810 family)
LDREINQILGNSLLSIHRILEMESTNSTDPYNLQRFVSAQDPVFEQVLSELCKGCKESHWMWFIFPQIKGLGHSPTSIEFAISSKAEAQAYIDHRILGPRLEECTRLVVRIEGRRIETIFGHPDYMKFRSSMTLFSQVSPKHEIFIEAIRKYFGGKLDPLTLERL